MGNEWLRGYPLGIPRTRIDGRDLFNFPKAGSVSRAPAPVVKPFP